MARNRFTSDQQTAAKDDSESLRDVRELLVDLREEVWPCGNM